MKKAYDLFVIGAGSGGVRAARVAAGLGASVAVAEVGALGGTCVNVGCVPKKLMVYASEVSAQVADAAGFGWSIEGAAFDWPVLLANKNREIERLNGVYRSLLEKSGVTIVHGRAALVDPHTIDVDGASYSARHVLLATGGRPTVPEFPGSEHAITSDDVFFLEKQPERVVVVGGGYIAVEFAGIFQGLGSEVTQLYRGPLFLRGFDADIRQHLATQMRSRGIDLRFESNVQAIEKQGDRLKLTLTDEGVMEADCVLYATGRRPNTAGLGLEACGVKLGERGEVIVDEHSRSSVSDIFAVGDCTDRVNLTPVAIAEGSAVARTLFAQEPTRVSYENVPTAVFSQPPVATVGLGEEAARRTLDGVQVYRSRFRPMKNTVSGRDEQALIKVVVEEASQRVVGVHMVGADAGEIIQGLAVAVVAGVTKAQLDQTIGIHPTTAEEFVTLREPVA